MLKFLFCSMLMIPLSFLMDLKNFLKNCLNILKLYASASGLCLNIDKTKVVWIGSKKGSTEKFCDKYNLQ